MDYAVTKTVMRPTLTQFTLFKK